MAFRPSSSCTVAATGQTCSQGAFSQCMQGTGWNTTAGVLGLAGEVAVDAQPVHLAAAAHLLAADHRHVVLALAGDRRRRCSRCRRRGRSPSPHCGLLLYSCSFHREKQLLVVGRRTSGSCDSAARLASRTIGAAVHAAVLLGLRQRIVAPRAADDGGREVQSALPRAGDRCRSRRRCRPGRRCCGRSRASRPAVPSAMPGTRNIGSSRLRPPASTLTTSPSFSPLGRGGFRADEQRVVPGDLGERIGQLLQPGVVGSTAVADLGAGREHELEVARRRC